MYKLLVELLFLIIFITFIATLNFAQGQNDQNDQNDQDVIQCQNKDFLQNLHSIVGVISDEIGQRITNVKISVTNQKQTYQTTSSEMGIFSIDNLLAGEYEVIFEGKEIASYRKKVVIDNNILLNCLLKTDSTLEIMEVHPTISRVEQDIFDGKAKDRKTAVSKEIAVRNNLVSYALYGKYPSPVELLYSGYSRDGGDIFLGVVVDSEGKVTSTFFLEGTNRFIDSASKAVKNWTFQKSKYGFLGYIGFRYSILETKGLTAKEIQDKSVSVERLKPVNRLNVLIIK